MRSAQVYRWQIPMDAGGSARQAVKTRDGLYVCLREGEREGWGDLPLPGFSQETSGRCAKCAACTGK